MEWYLTKYNYQTFINEYNDFFLLDIARKWNIYKKDAYSDVLIKLFNFDKEISAFILRDILNIETFLQNAIIQAFKNTYEKWKNIENVSKEDIHNLLCEKILKLSDKTWNLIFSKEINSSKTKLKFKSLWGEIISKLERKEHNKLIAKYLKNFLGMPIWSIIIFLDFGTLIRIMNFFNTVCFNYAIKYFQEKLCIDIKWIEKNLIAFFV